MKKRKKRGRFYFDVDVEKAIVLYNKEDDPIIRNQIYNESIKYALEKLAENIINTFKFPYIPEKFANKKADVVSHLILNLNKYDETKGKAYSYFGQAAKNYLIINNDSNYKKLKTDMSIHSEEDSTENDPNIFELEDHHIVGDNVKEDYQRFIDELIGYLDSNIKTMFKKPNEIKIANAIIQLLQNYDSIENYSKKNIYIMLRDMTNCKATQITGVLDKIRNVYTGAKEQYMNNGHISSRAFFTLIILSAVLLII